jgi:hypothetical protein
LSNEGFARVSSLVKSTIGTPLASRRKLAAARKEIETKIDYQFNENGDVCLMSVEEVLEERRSRLKIESDSRGLAVVFSLDKGRGRVVSTISQVYHPRPCSYYNHLPIQCWQGSDTHEALRQRDIGYNLDRFWV